MKTCFLFPGQGAQYPGMARDFYETSKAVRDLFALASEASGIDLKKLLFEGSEEELKQTRNTQIAVALAGAASATCAREHGVHPRRLRRLLGRRVACPGRGRRRLVRRHVPPRGRARKAHGRGGQALGRLDDERGALALAPEAIEAAIRKAGLAKVWVANYNSPTQSVISGTEADVAAAEVAVKAAGAKRADQAQGIRGLSFAHHGLRARRLRRSGRRRCVRRPQDRPLLQRHGQAHRQRGRGEVARGCPDSQPRALDRRGGGHPRGEARFLRRDGPGHGARRALEGGRRRCALLSFRHPRSDSRQYPSKRKDMMEKLLSGQDMHRDRRLQRHRPGHRRALRAAREAKVFISRGARPRIRRPWKRGRCGRRFDEWIACDVADEAKVNAAVEPSSPRRGHRRPGQQCGRHARRPRLPDEPRGLGDRPAHEPDERLPGFAAPSPGT